MANISSRRDALAVLRANFATAQQSGSIGKGAFFTLRMVKEVVVERPGNGRADQCQLIYCTESGAEDPRVLRSHCYPALVTD